MKSIVFILVMLFSTVMYAGEKIDMKLDVPANGELEISNNRGKVQVKGWDKNVIRVKGRLDDLTDDFSFTSKDGKSIINIILKDKNIHAKSGSGSKLEIFVPQAYAVQFGGVATDLKFSNIKKGIYINSVSGNVEIENVHTRSYINIVSGEVLMKDISGTIEVYGVSGDINISADSSVISVSAVSANVVVKTKNITKVKISNVSGNSKLYGKVEELAEVNLSNISGGSYFYVEGELSARVDLETGPGGEVSNRYSNDKPMSSYIGAEKLSFTAGKGDGLVVMSTASGEIGLRSAKKRK